MKKYFISRAALGIAIASSSFTALRAEEDGGDDSKNVQVVVVQTGDKHLEATLDNVKAQLEKAGVPEEKREQILKQLKESLAGAKKAGAFTEVRKMAARIKSDKAATEKEAAADKSETVEVVVLNDENTQDKPMVAKVLKSLNADGSYRIGITYDSSEASGEKELKGIKIGKVIVDSPAEKAGIKQGDQLVTVNGISVAMEELQSEVQKAGKEGKTLTLTLEREGKEVKVDVKPTKLKVSDEEMSVIKLANPSHGFVLGDREHGGVHQVFKEFGPMAASGAFAFSTEDTKSLKKDIEELKAQIDELKTMLKELVNKGK